MTYVAGFIMAVPRKNREAYRKVSEKMAKFMHELGAIKVVECWGEDVPDGEITSFPKAVKCKEDEVVVFSWIIWPSKEACQAATEKMHKLDKFHFGDMTAILDLKRMFYGGFEVLVEV